MACCSYAGDRGTSCTEQFDINVSPVVPPSCDVSHELRQVHTTIIRHISLLRKVYHVYSSLGDPMGRGVVNKSTQVMTRMQVSVRCLGEGGHVCNVGVGGRRACV